MKRYLILFISVLTFGLVVGIILPEDTPARVIVMGLTIAAFAGLVTALQRKRR